MSAWNQFHVPTFCMDGLPGHDQGAHAGGIHLTLFSQVNYKVPVSFFE
jgi:hypothetical protein